MSEYKFESGILTTPSGQATLTSEHILPGLIDECCNEIDRLTAALESANQRAEEAEDKLNNWAETHMQTLFKESDRALHNAKVAETLKASLADKEGELETSKLIEITHNATIQELDAELSSLREQLRTFRKAWQDQDDTALDTAMDALFDAIPTESPDTGEGS